MGTRSSITAGSHCVLGFILVATACASSDETGPGSSSGNSSSGGSSGLVSPTDGGGVDPGVLEGCATDTAKANPLPLDLYVMFDSSGSMNQEASPGVSKMKATTDALKAFFNDPSSAGISVALTFFPAHPPGAAYQCNSAAQCGTKGVCTNKMCALAGVTFCANDNDCDGSPGVCQEAGICSDNSIAYCYILGQQCPNNWGQCNAQPTNTAICVAKDVCDMSNYTPVVPFGALPGSSVSLGLALSSKIPFGATPTSAALGAAEQGAFAYANANAGHTVAVLLVTDGIPSECNTNIDDIAAVAKIGADATPKIRTFVIGVFGAADQATAQTNLDKIAAAGDGGKAFIVGVGANTTKDFTDAMNQVRGKALPCEYKIPQPDGGIPDYGKVNVQHTTPGGAKTVYPYAKSAAGCAGGGGWYFDTEPTGGATPGKIILCPNTCTEANAAGGQVDVVLGCQTVVR